MSHDTPNAGLPSSDDHHGGKRYIRYTRVSAAERAVLIAELAERYARGADVRELADETGCSFGFVRKLLHEGDVEMRPRTRRPTQRPNQGGTTATATTEGGVAE